MSLQKLGTVGRTWGPVIYISAARHANNLTPKGGVLGPDKARLVLTKWVGEVEGNGERNICKAMISQSRAAVAMGYTEIPGQISHWGKCKLEGSSKERGES